MSELFARCDAEVCVIYDAILQAVGTFGAVRAEEKKTSIHLVAKTGFAGVHPRKSSLLLNIRSAKPIASPRVRKVEQANRFHNEMLVATPAEVDGEMIGWLKAAYDLSVG